MSIEFEDSSGTGPAFKSRTVLGAKVTPLMVVWLIKTGVVKTEQKAWNLLMAMTLLFFAISIVLIYMNFIVQPSFSQEDSEKLLRDSGQLPY